jgi:hypothetical protein
MRTKGGDKMRRRMMKPLLWESTPWLAGTRNAR